MARLRDRLGAAPRSFARGLRDLLLGPRTLDAALLEELETLLVSADVGVETTRLLIDGLTQRIARKELADTRAGSRC